MSEMRVQSASLLCKVFLQYMVLLSEWEGMLDLWVKIVDIMDRLMNSGQGDSLVSSYGSQIECLDIWMLMNTVQEEAVRENLKNVLLFMSSSGYLVSPKQDPSKEKLWTETWKRIDRFLPDLRSDLALEEPDEEPAKTEPAKTEPAVEANAKKDSGVEEKPEVGAKEAKQAEEVEEATKSED